MLPLARLAPHLTVSVALVVVSALGGAALGAVPNAAQVPVQQMLTLATVAITVTAALALSVAGRLDGDVAATWIGAGLLVYAVFALPITAARFGNTVGPVGELVDVVCLAAATTMLGLGLSGRPGPVRSRWLTCGVCATGVGVVTAAALVPQVRPMSDALDVAVVGVLLLWAAVAVSLVAAGVRQYSVLRQRVGFGLALLAVSHLGQTEAFREMLAGPALTALRSVAVIVIVVGVVPHLRACVRSIRDRDLAAASRLDAAEQEARDRDHELRNLVLGLSGAVTLLAQPDHEGRADLSAAMSAELQRLERLLDRAPRSGHGRFDVHDALRTAVVVQRAAGMPITLDVAADLTVRGDGQALTQVVTNLLLNCHRHARGTLVRVSASEVNGSVLVLVRDHGPGIPLGHDHAVFERGHRDEAGGGRGLGLGISRRLVRDMGGDLHLTRPADGGPGCLAVLTLPATARPRAVAQLAH